MKLTAIAPFPPGWDLYKHDGTSAPVIGVGLVDGTAVPLILLAPSGEIVAASEIPNGIGLFHENNPDRPGGYCDRRRRA